MTQKQYMDSDEHIPSDDEIAICLAEIVHYLSIGLDISFGSAIHMMNSTNIIPFTLELELNKRQWIAQDAESAAIRIAEVAGLEIKIKESRRHLVSLF